MNPALHCIEFARERLQATPHTLKKSEDSFSGCVQGQSPPGPIKDLATQSVFQFMQHLCRGGLSHSHRLRCGA